MANWPSALRFFEYLTDPKLNANPGFLFRNGFARPVASKSANYTATNADWLILGTGGAGGITITLPTAVGIAGWEFVVKKVDAGAGAVNVASTSAQTFDGAATPYTGLSATQKYVRVVSDGANWQIVGAG